MAYRCVLNLRRILVEPTEGQITGTKLTMKTLAQVPGVNTLHCVIQEVLRDD